MTPEALQTLVSLREEFYSLFQKAVRKPISVEKRNSLIFNPSFQSVASWVDDQKRVNFMSLYAHQSPDALFPNRPLMLRLAINPQPGTSQDTIKRATGALLNQDWSLELTLLPEEILAFAEWVAQWITAQNHGLMSPVNQRAPFALHTAESSNGCDRIWTQAAWKHSVPPETRVEHTPLAQKVAQQNRFGRVSHGYVNFGLYASA